MPAKTTFSTDRELRNLKPAAKHFDVKDKDCRNLIVRVSPTNRKTFALLKRFPGQKNPTRHAFGEFPDLSLEDAREMANEWRAAIRRGIDPRPKRQEPEAEPEQAETFASVAEAYIKRHVAGQRRAKDTTREIRRELIAVWGDRPIGSITKADVTALIDAIVDRGSPATAHLVLAHARGIYNWCIAAGRYGLESSPCDRLKPAKLIGERKPRQRVLTDDELRAYWKAAGKMGYPFGPLYRLAALTGARRAEIGEAEWSEFDLDKAIWTVPPERFKSDSEHLVPLSDDVVAILRDLPRFKQGHHLFSCTFGAKPVTGFSYVKVRLDARMLRALKAMARQRGADPSEVKLPPWVLHDVRRTVRTRLSSLRVPDRVAEMVIGHGAKGLQRVYDQHRYLDEMREALQQWAARLREIVTPPPDNVVRINTDWDREVQELVEQVKANHPGASEETIRRMLIESGA